MIVTLDLSDLPHALEHLVIKPDDVVTRLDISALPFYRLLSPFTTCSSLCSSMRAIKMAGQLIDCGTRTTFPEGLSSDRKSSIPTLSQSGTEVCVIE